MSSTQKLLGCLLALFLAASLSGNVALFLWVRYQISLTEEKQAEIESLRREIRDLRQELSEASQAADPALLQAAMDGIAGQTEELRAMEPVTPVSRQLMSQAEMAEFIARKMKKEYTPEEASQDEVVMSALELIPPDLDLYQLTNDLMEEQVAGLYDPDDETFYVLTLKGKIGPLEKTIFAHEYTHALQDQHFDLEALGLGSRETGRNDDQLKAVQALAEGDATLAMQFYMQRNFTAGDILGLFGSAMSVNQQVFNRAPAYLRHSLTFPYEQGLAFALSRYQEGGWSAVDAAYARLPQSTEQILHPERYPGNVPRLVSLPPLTGTLGSGWRLVDENVLGEFTLSAYLDVYLIQSQAAQAAAGWGGDRYAVYRNANSGQTLLALLVAWDDSAEEAEFVTAYQEYALERMGNALPRPEGTGRTWWIGKKDALLLARSSAPSAQTRTLIVLAPDEGTARRVLQAFSGF
jgi:hypothetical protein